MELSRRKTSRTRRAEDFRRARVILLLAEWRTWDVVCQHLGCSHGFFVTWQQRFVNSRLASLYNRHRGQRPTPSAPASKPAFWRPPVGLPPIGPRTGAHANWGSTILWGRPGSGPSMASSRTVWNAIWPLVIRTSSPKRLRSAACNCSPQHAAVSCVNEKTAIQAMDGKDPVLPLSSGRVERHGFEYYRHGTRNNLASSRR